ncbi:hypothetical protein ABID22_000422 [Pontibacter aydingkolensis]|uniref:Uncharacterized protein n=1 Tax=Pontibacter aydingkolensis TaxID=1911536 RepID=A0ABS7CQ13_9BACT|nr:hypothetical protein [Pontibacter aydingkolensis]MBW7465914.1 hypothetical protein [Pontibacter aydingkolensis]
MKIFSRLLLPVAVLGFVACSEKEQKTNNTPAATTTAPFNTTATPAAGTTNGATAALNPEHGQPNHRCDIPVGAPLNTPVQPKLNAPTPTTTITPPMPQPQMQQSTGTVAAGTNPPHGQPGHDCAKPVGAPL